MSGIQPAVHAQPADQGVANELGVWGKATRATMRVQQVAEPGTLLTIERTAWTVAEHATAVPGTGVGIGHRSGVLC